VFPTHEHTEHRTHHHKEKKKESLPYHLIPTNDNSQHTDLYHELGKTVIKNLEHVTTHRGTHITTLQMANHNILICVTNSIRLSSRIWSTWQHIAAHTSPSYHRLPTYGKSQHTHLCHELCRAIIKSLQHMNKHSSVHITTINPKFFRTTNYAGIFGFCWY